MTEAIYLEVSEKTEKFPKRLDAGVPSPEC